MIQVGELEYGIFIGCTVLNMFMFIINVLYAMHNDRVICKFLKNFMQLCDKS